MLAAVEDVEHRHGKQRRVVAAEMSVERNALRSGSRVSNRQRYSQDRVGAQPRLRLRAVEVDQQLVERSLIGGAGTDDRFRDLPVHVVNSLEHALPAIAALIAITQLQRLVLARAGAGRHGGAAHRAVLQLDIDLQRRVASRVEDLPGVYGADLHRGPLLLRAHDEH